MVRVGAEIFQLNIQKRWISQIEDIVEVEFEAGEPIAIERRQESWRERTHQLRQGSGTR